MDNDWSKYQSEISELKAEIERLQKIINTDKYKVIFDASPDIIIQLDSQYRILVIHMPDIEKSRLEALKGRNLFEVTPHYAHKKMADALNVVFSKKESVKYYSEGETLGSYRYYENYLSPIKGENNEIDSVYFISREITAQKLAEKVLLESERKLNTVYENSIQFLTIFDVDRRFVWFNRNAKEKSAVLFRKEISVGEIVDNVIAENYVEAFISNFNRVLSGETIMYSRKYGDDNQPFYLDITLSPIYENQQVVGVALSSTNVTKHKVYEDYLKRINMELVQQNEQLNQYSYIISHNLRGPITTLKGLVKVFDFADRNSEETEDVIRHIYKSVDNLDTIIKDLNLVINNSVQEGSIKVEVDLREECDTILSLLITQVEQSGAEFDFNFDQCPSLVTIKSYIHSILYNLIFNAIKYRRLDVLPIIKVSSFLMKDNVVGIECSDNGLGINLEKYGNQLFGFYKRFHSHIDGKGLGLLLVKKQVELLGGRIEVESVVNEGTTFRVLLPL